MQPNKNPPGTSSANEALPLGWTRVVRNSNNRPIRYDQQNGTTTFVGDKKDTSTLLEFCCNDPQCRRPRQPHDDAFDPFVGITSADLTTSLTSHTRVTGTVIFCLPDTDPDWFQGYLVTGSRQYGLIGQKQEIDACLQCAEGGCREIHLQVTPFGTSGQQHVLENVEWTGCDMMKLDTAASEAAVAFKKQKGIVHMQADSVWTGDLAVSRVERIFGGLIRNLRQVEDNPQATVLELMPNVAVVSGTMELFLPTKTMQHESNELDF